MTNKPIRKPQPESVADFKQRLAIIMRERETGKKYSIVGASRADECVVRGQQDRGYDLQPRKETQNANDR
jgi:hypothetical protein